MSGGGGFDPGKELAQLDKDLSLSQNAPTIAAAVAAFYGAPYLMESIGAASTAGAATSAASAEAAAAAAGSIEASQLAGLASLAPAATAAAPAAAAGAELAGAGAFGDIAAGNAAAGAAVPTAATGAVPGAAGVDAIGSGINAPYVGQQAAMATNMAAPPAPSGIAGMFDKAATAYGGLPTVLKYGIPLAAVAMYADRKSPYPGQEPYDGPLNKLKYDPDRYKPLEVKPPTPYTPVYKDYRNMADGGFLGAVGKGFGADLARLLNRQQEEKYTTPPLNYDPARYDPEVGTKMVARPGMAGGGLADLGGYADYARGGRMLKGPGDGMSDSIPAVIAGKQPARLANDEFVVPADVVSHLGNGSSDAGAKQLYRMMDKVRAARTGKQAQAKQINPNKYMPA